jgi:UDP-N-acetylmuramyl pentapeptide phosphotransferase/UDP-N-acetylglucosamine-1-phosphate transferase
MPCLLFLLILLFPRVAIALLFFFSTYLDRPFHNALLLLILGFIFLPLTTLVYAWMFNSGIAIAGINILYLIVAVIVDLGLLGGGYRTHRGRLD